MLVSFLICLLGFTLVGIASVYKSKGGRHDYYLASGGVPPWLVGLSAVATNNSGYMFIGVIGYTYVVGLSAFWLMIGWISGDFLASLFVHRRLTSMTRESGQISYAGVLSHWHGEKQPVLQRLIGILSLIFLLAYASAQLVAGSKALHVLLAWPTWAGAVTGAVIVAIYCLSGGIRASIWTDAAQSFVMVFAMALLLFMAVMALGGISPAVMAMAEIDGFLDVFPKDLALPGLAGGLMFAVGWLAAGFSVIGQPHIMVRFMTLDASGSMRRAKAWYYGWFTVFYTMATLVGMLSRVYLPDSAQFDAELALPVMAQQILPPVWVGVILAGIFAATMSTADSLVLSCSAAITHDLSPNKYRQTWQIKGATFGVTLLALIWALLNNQTVFNLVILAWSGLASAFAPLLIVYCLGWRPTQKTAVVAVIAGLTVALCWRWLGWHTWMYEGLPGMLSGLMVLSCDRLFHLSAVKKLSAKHS